ncbi:MAG: N-acetylmuramoyl-L-alanine amidase [Candidatus Cloacimonetes bacterium]|nr:N-acetylmuramoyl-L-alanine amidase [Candidatus Cloacimonadota bacterium]
MKRILIILSLLLFVSSIWADLTVKFKGTSLTEKIDTKRFDNTEYFRASELNKVFHAKISDDKIDQRLYVNLYDEQIIFLIETSYVQHRDKIYNFKYPIRSQKGKFYIPVLFLKKILPKLLPDKIKYSGKNLIAENPRDDSIKRIVIDPGHGGKDPGAVSINKKNYEKTIVLKVAQKLSKIIIKELNCEVLITRTKDEFISLQERTRYANSNNADLFISLHCNAHRSNKANGIEVYYLSTAKTDDARAVEALENSVVYDFEGGTEAVKKYDDLSFILADMAQNEHLRESNELAMKLQENLIQSTKSYDRGVKQANFYVLRGAFMPAVLIELGFLSNKKEEKKLMKDSYQNTLAKAIFEGLKSFKLKYDSLQ